MEPRNNPAYWYLSSTYWTHAMKTKKTSTWKSFLPSMSKKHQQQLLCSCVDVFLRIQRPKKSPRHVFHRKTMCPTAFFALKHFHNLVLVTIFYFFLGEKHLYVRHLQKKWQVIFPAIEDQVFMSSTWRNHPSWKLWTLHHPISEPPRFVQELKHCLVEPHVGWTCFRIGCSWLFFVGKPLNVHQCKLFEEPGSKGGYQWFSNWYENKLKATDFCN